MVKSYLSCVLLVAASCMPPGQGRIDHSAELTVSQAEWVESYRVRHMCGDPEMASTRNCLSGYNITDQGPRLNDSQTLLLQQVILDQSNYKFEHLKCGFNPSVGFRFVRGEEYLNVLLDFSCFMWSFHSQGKHASSQFAPAKEILSGLVDELFPGVQSDIDR